MFLVCSLFLGQKGTYKTLYDQCFEALVPLFLLFLMKNYIKSLYEIFIYIKDFTKNKEQRNISRKSPNNYQKSLIFVRRLRHAFVCEIKKRRVLTNVVTNRSVHNDLSVIHLLYTITERGF